MAPSGECLQGYKPRAVDCSRLAPRVAASCLANPVVTGCYLLLCAGITRCAVLPGSLCLCIVSVVERCDLTDIKRKIYFFMYLARSITLETNVRSDTGR